jgi:hypothetical protein
MLIVSNIAIKIYNSNVFNLGLMGLRIMVLQLHPVTIRVMYLKRYHGC